MSKCFVYYVGGPADLTKQDWPTEPPDCIWHAIPGSLVPYVDRRNKEEAEYTCKRVEYKTFCISKNIYIAIHEPI